jgi:pyridoxine 5-phosphate synthase
MARLSVNLNKIALIRNSRGANLPDLLKVALDCEEFGAQGITIHPRPDERHAKFSDIEILKNNIKTELNIEGFPNKHFIDAVLKHKPNQVTLVPDPPDALTSNTGWDTIAYGNFLFDIISEFKKAEIRTSIFINPELTMIEEAPKTGTDRIELYTGPYSSDYWKDKKKAIEPYIEASKMANKLGLGLNAGHDLNLDNLTYFKENVNELLEVSIGHALICDSIYFGLKNTIQMYLNRLQ